MFCLEAVFQNSGGRLPHHGLMTGLMSFVWRLVMVFASIVSECLVCGSLSHKNAHITPVLRNLLWLPIREGVIFKIVLLAFKALNDFPPCNIKEAINS